MYWQAGHNFPFKELAGRTQVNLLSRPVFNISFIQQRTGVVACRLVAYRLVAWYWRGERRRGAALLHSCAAMGWAVAPSSRASVSSSGSQWQDWEQGVGSGTGWLLGSSRESVGGGEGESVPGSEVGAPVAPLWGSLRFWTFLLSSLRSTLSARRSFSSRWTLPWSASKSRSRTDFWRQNTHTHNVLHCTKKCFLGKFFWLDFSLQR